MMKVFIASEFRCHIYNNKYYLSRRAFTIYKRYANKFGKVVLCSRFVKLEKLEDDMYEVDFIVDTVHIESLFKALIGVKSSLIQEKMEDCSLIICRMPSIIAYQAANVAKKLNKPILAELMCDGWDPYWNHGFFGKIIAPYMHMKMRNITYNAPYAVYVTEKFLQKKYPCKNPSIGASNVEIKSISNEVLKNRLQLIEERDIKDNFSIMTTATVDLLSKGQRFVVEAIGELKKKGIIVTYYLVGDGKQDHLKEVAKKNHVEDQLIFLGTLTLEQIYELIDKVDLYIQPSLQEGLPRAVIEAMSRACPCLGARTAGIPELLDEECIFERSSSHSIVLAIERIISKGLSGYAMRNFNHSKEYLETILDKRRNSYFSEICRKLK